MVALLSIAHGGAEAPLALSGNLGNWAVLPTVGHNVNPPR